MKSLLKTIGTLAAVATVCLATATAVQAKDYKVAFIARAQADSFAAWLANGIMDEAKKYPDIKLDVMDSQADDAKENAFIENAVANKYDLIIVQPNNGEAQRPFVERAVKDGVKVILRSGARQGVQGALDRCQPPRRPHAAGLCKAQGDQRRADRPLRRSLE